MSPTKLAEARKQADLGDRMDRRFDKLESELAKIHKATEKQSRMLSALVSSDIEVFRIFWLKPVPTSDKGNTLRRLRNPSSWFMDRCRRRKHKNANTARLNLSPSSASWNWGSLVCD